MISGKHIHNVRNAEIELFEVGNKSFLGFEFVCDLMNGEILLEEAEIVAFKISLDLLGAYEYDN